jgi:hypothetical protein
MKKGFGKAIDGTTLVGFVGLVGGIIKIIT